MDKGEPSGRSVRDADWGIGPDIVTVDECVPGKSHKRQLGSLEKGRN
jgi:hypothetical protein